MSAWFDSISFLLGLIAGAVVTTLLMTLYKFELLGELRERVAEAEKQLNLLMTQSRKSIEPTAATRYGEGDRSMSESELKTFLSELQEEISRMYRRR